ncbi:MAG: LamG-like jellyroll fold domain-containing protein, partial [Oscillospiraceae bacterium]
TDAAAQSNGKPIFVGMHPNAYEKVQANTITAENGTVFGSYPVNGYKNQATAKSDYWATSELYNAIKPHANAVTFSGHSHWTVANESSIHQRDFTSMNTGAVNNMEIENAWDESFQPNRLGFANENESNGYFITVNTEQKINVERMDLARANSKLGEDWNFNPLDKTSWKYTADRDKVAPTFGLGATVTVTDIGEQTCKIGFDQATDNVDVNNYTVEIIDKSTGVVVKKYTPSAFYWMQTVPLKNEWIATDLLPGNTYTAKVTAYDTFGNVSTTSIESAEFKTTERAVTPSAITDISFTNDGIQDTSEFARFYGIKPIKHGTVPVTYNNDIKMYEGNFARNAGDTNSPNFFKVLFDAQRKALMQTGEGYTIDLMFKQSALQTDNNIIGAAQSGGFDIETDATGVLSSCVRHGGAWVGGSSKPGSNITTVKDIYYHITLTYDGFNIKVYKDGVLTDIKPASGAIEFTDIMSADGFYGMVIGGDYNPTGTAPAYTDQENAQNAFSGNITFAKVYNSALTQSEITKKVSALNARKNLTQIDALNTMLTVTLPAAKLGGENAYVDKLLSEGWKIMNSETLTDEEITAFLTKAENTTSYTMPYSFDAKNVEFASGTNAVPFAKYGFTANTSNVLWSVLKMNDISSVYSDAVRFSTRSNIGDKEIMRLTFAKDTVGNPEAVKFNGKKHTYESEFSFRYQTGGEG